MQKVIFSSVFIFTLASGTTWAAPKTVTLALPTMNCAMCPLTVKKALTNVDGVLEVDVSYSDKQAVITFEDSTTSVRKLIEATSKAGYPSTTQSEVAQ